MKKYLIIFSYALVGCSVVPVVQSVENKKIEKTSIRAISIERKDKVWFAGSGGKVGIIEFEQDSILIKQVADAKVEFRSSALVGENFLAINVDTPAILVAISKDLNVIKNVYHEEGEKVFYDSMYFTNSSNGVIVGDPTADCFSILVTNDGWNSWNKIPCQQLPKLVEGEAAFAASNTNVKVIGSTIFIISGGKKSRLFKSKDFGQNWTVFETPIIQGEAMTGAFTMDFYNENIGIIAGGNYEKQEDNSKNKAITFDGGKTWELLAPNLYFGYTSCIQFVPNKKGKELVACGASGVFYSKNFGKTWSKLSDDKEFYTLRILDSKTIYLAGRSKISKMKLK